MMLTVIASLQVGGCWFSFLLLLFSLVAFYIAQWEEYGIFFEFSYRIGTILVY
jgi:hypothetical protein